MINGRHRIVVFYLGLHSMALLELIYCGGEGKIVAHKEVLQIFNDEIYSVHISK